MEDEEDPEDDHDHLEGDEGAKDDDDGGHLPLNSVDSLLDVVNLYYRLIY